MSPKLKNARPCSNARDVGRLFGLIIIQNVNRRMGVNGVLSAPVACDNHRHGIERMPHAYARVREANVEYCREYALRILQGRKQRNIYWYKNGEILVFGIARKLLATVFASPRGRLITSQSETTPASP
jgi:hypothetical protein